MGKQGKVTLAHGTKKGSRAPVSLSPRPIGDTGATGPANQAELETGEPWFDHDTGKVVNPEFVKRARRVDMMETYYRRGIISQRGHIAIVEFRLMLEPPPRTDGVKVDGGIDPTWRIAGLIDHQARPLRLLSGMSLRDREIITEVAIEGRAVSYLPQYRNRLGQTGQEVLAVALDRLADAMGK